MNKDLFYMQQAYKEALKAYNKKDVPVGCVIVHNDKIIARGHNLRNDKKNVLYHAEIIAIDKACKKLHKWILDDCTLYVTVEPCIMCAGTILQARVKRLVYGAPQQRYGCIESMMHLFTDYDFNNCPIVDSGIMKEEVQSLLKTFFEEMREEKKKQVDE